MNRDNQEEDLTRIKGIGPARKRWLREKLGISTLEDLVSVDLETIDKDLDVWPLSPGHREIADWIRQAEELIAERERKSSPSLDLDPSHEQFGKPRQYQKENESSDAGCDSESHWQPVATFIIEIQENPGPDGTPQYRTYVYQMDVDAEQTVSEHCLKGVEIEQQCLWMLQCLDALFLEKTKASGQQEMATVELLHTEPSESQVLQDTSNMPQEVGVNILSIGVRVCGRAHQYLSTAKIEKSLPVPASCDVDLDAEFELTGTGALMLAAQGNPVLATAHINGHAGTRYRKSETTTDPVNLRKGKTRYSVPIVSSLSLPTGCYTTWVSITVPASTSLIHSTRGPVLIVT